MTEQKAEGAVRKSRRRTAVIVVACFVAAALLAAGIGLGVHARNERIAHEAHERTVAAAQARCDKSIDGLTAARGILAKQIKADRTQAALKLTSDKVADAKTLQELRKESTDDFSATSCRATSISVLDSHAKANQEASRKAADQATRLTAAVAGVERSKAAKDEADRKAEEARKAQEQRKAQEAAAAAEAQREAQSRQQQSSNAGSQRSYQRGNGSHRRSYQSYRSTRPRYNSSNSGTQRQQQRQTPQQPQRQQPPQQEHHWNLGGDAQTSHGGGVPPHIYWGN